MPTSPTAASPTPSPARSDAVKHVELKLNNSNRVQDDNNGFYFRQVQPYQHHSSIPTRTCTVQFRIVSGIGKPQWTMQF